MNLDHFETYIDDVILKRGMDYFHKRHVGNVEETSENHYLVEVEGTEVYHVEIILDDHNDIIEAACDCPYDLGEHCKHQAAALFAIRNERNSTSKKSKKGKTETAKEEDLPSLLSNFSKEKLIEMIIVFSKKYPDIEKQLLFKYASGQNEIAASKKLIKEYIRKAAYRGFIEWNRVTDALAGANLVLQKAHYKLETDDFEGAVGLGIIVLSSVVDMLSDCDDSGGETTVVIDESLEIIDEAISLGAYHLNEQQKVKLFEKIMKETLHNRYEGWSDWRLNLIQSCIQLASNSTIRKKLEKQIAQMIESSENEDSWSSNYLIEHLKLLQLELLERYDKEERALQFIHENIRYSAFREKEIIRQLEKENYQEVIRLCLVGEDTDQDYRGLVHQWKKYRLKAYIGLGDISSQREMMLDFLLNDHFEYYLNLKKLYTLKEWPEVLQNILKTFESRSYLPGTYLEILKYERLSGKLLEYCQSMPSSIESLYVYLINDYHEEVNILFKNDIESAAEQASDRKKYRQVCSIIKTYEKVFGKNNANQLINILKEKYKRRPAFTDELGKIKFLHR